MQNKKYWFYPIVIIITVLILGILNIHGSSVGKYYQQLFPEEEDSALLFGSPRAIKSDQYLVELPNIISQDKNNESTINEDLGEGTNLGINSYPTKNIFTIFKPSLWIFFISNNTEFSFSFYWWSRFALLIISTYLLILQLTNRNLLLSIGGSLLFLFTPFIQWWVPVDPIITISFGLFCFIRLIKEENVKKRILYGLGLSYWMISFALILYPAFQIPMAYSAAFIALGVILKNKRTLFSNKKNLIKIFCILTVVATCVGLFLFLFLKEFEDVIAITSNTVYPGSRFISAGGGSIYHLLNGFYNILMQKDSNGAPFGNQCEASNFFMLYVPLIFWVIYKNISRYKKKLPVDWLGISMSLVLIFLTAWYLFPLPDLVSKYTAMYMVLPQRVFIGIGFTNYILILYVLSKNIYILNKRSIIEWLLMIILIASFGLLMYFTGKDLYNSNPDSFVWPSIISANIKILLVVILAPLLFFFLIRGYRKIFITIFIMFGFVSTALINPIYQGLDVLIDTDLANYIEDTSSKDDSKWIVYGNHYFAQYALANNASIINGVHPYPQFKIWEILDPEGKYVNLYNRYAHISVSEYEEGEEMIVLTAMDAIDINIDPCDEKLKQLKIKYILSTDKLENTCLNLKKEFEDYNIFIYMLNQ